MKHYYITGQVTEHAGCLAPSREQAIATLRNRGYECETVDLVIVDSAGEEWELPREGDKE